MVKAENYEIMKHKETYQSQYRRCGKYVELTNFIGSGGDHDGKLAVQESVMSSGGVRVTLTSQGSHATRLADPDLLHVLDRDGPSHACDLGSISSMTTLLQHVTP